jgi:hypothetical protein
LSIKINAQCDMTDERNGQSGRLYVKCGQRPFAGWPTFATQSAKTGGRTTLLNHLVSDGEAVRKIHLDLNQKPRA